MRRCRIPDQLVFVPSIFYCDESAGNGEVTFSASMRRTSTGMSCSSNTKDQVFKIQSVPFCRLYSND